MWIRLRLDITWSDLAAAAVSCGAPANRAQLQREAERFWSDADDVVVSLSVRSAFDLILQAAALPPKSEVLLSALTLPDMVRIVENHGLVPVPVDLVKDGVTPCVKSLRDAITPASRAIVLAHLFGSRIPIEPFVEVARQEGLLLVEDCAQAYCGCDYLGHPESDVAMFSFGPIKTATALGGGVARVKNRRFANRIRRLQSQYPVQSRTAYFLRLLRYGALKALSARPIFGAIAWSSRVLGLEHDHVVGNAARNFPRDKLVDQIRQQPSAPLLHLLLRRWRRYGMQRLRQRARKGHLLLQQMGSDPQSMDQGWEWNTHWVFPVLATDPVATVRRLRQLGFDATSRIRLGVVAAPPGREELDPVNLRNTLSKLVLLPWYPELTPDSIQEMASGLKETRPLASCVTARATTGSIR